MSDSFNLFNLDVTVVGDPATFVCSHKIGHAFNVEGENIVFDTLNDRFSLYSLAAILPLLPAKQRLSQDNDWISSDNEMVACPDTQCSAKFKITRTTQQSFRHSDVTKLPIGKNSKG